MSIYVDRPKSQVSGDFVTLDLFSGEINPLRSQVIDMSGVIQSLLTGSSASPSNSEIYRNTDNQITGIKYDNDFSRIYRNSNNKITGIYYNNYFKKILYDIDDTITGVNVVYY